MHYLRWLSLIHPGRWLASSRRIDMSVIRLYRMIRTEIVFPRMLNSVSVLIAVYLREVVVDPLLQIVKNCANNRSR